MHGEAETHRKKDTESQRLRQRYTGTQRHIGIEVWRMRDNYTQ